MSRHTARTRTGQDRTGLYQEITDKIIAELGGGPCALGPALGDGGGEGAAGPAQERFQPEALLRNKRVDFLGRRH